MDKSLFWTLVVIICALGAYIGYSEYEDLRKPPPVPVAPTPPPAPCPKPKPRCPLCPQGDPFPGGVRKPTAEEAKKLAVESFNTGIKSIYASPGKPVVGGLVSPDGTEEIADPLPQSEKKKNVGGSDGSGLCVFTSIEYAGRWANERSLFDFQEKMRQERGGGWPQKVDAMMAKYAPTASYFQDETGNYNLIKQAVASGRMVGVTYGGFDPHYGQQYVAHMVAVAHASDKWVAITDNNFPADNSHVWMSVDEFVKRHRAGGNGWSVFLTKPGPSPTPKGKAAKAIGPLSPAMPAWEKLENVAWAQAGEMDALIQNGKQIGVWDNASSTYRALNADGTWGDPDLPPCAIPARAHAKNFGLGGNDKAIGAGLHFGVIPWGNALPEDQNKPFLTVIGSDTDRAKVINDLGSPALSELAKGFRVQDYSPTDWAVKDVGFVTTGTPTVYIQTASGAVLHRQDGYTGATDLAAAMSGALRKTDPTYQPAADPNLNSILPTGIPPGLLVAGGLALAAAGSYVANRKK